MQPLLLKTYQTAKKPPATKSQALAAEIYLHYGKRLPFPRILGMIRLKGNSGVREAFEEARKSDAKDKLALFIWKVSAQKVDFKVIPNVVPDEYGKMKI